MMISGVYLLPDNLRRGCQEEGNRPAPLELTVVLGLSSGQGLDTARRAAGLNLKCCFK